MKHSTLFIPIAFILISFTSCLNVFQPVFEEKDLITIDAVSGKWMQNSVSITIEKAANSKLIKMLRPEIKNFNGAAEKSDEFYSDKSYILSYEKNGIIYYYALEFSKVDNSTYAQLIPVVAAPNDSTKSVESRYVGFMGQDLISTYGLAKVFFDGKNKLRLVFFDGEKIKDLVLNNKMKIPYAYDAVFNNFLITAESNTLKSFVTKYGVREDLFSSLHTYTLTRQ